MFTGIIQEVGSLVARRSLRAGLALRVRAPETASGLRPGDSVSVSGVCQTVEAAGADVFDFTAVGETLSRTTLGSLRVGAAVNLERSATAETALGGHLVQGHVDGVGEVQSFARRGQDRLLAVRVPPELARFVVSKGSIAVDGVSLTAIEVKRGGVVTITIVPFTLEKTIIGRYRVGTKVNIETDIVAKYVASYLEHLGSRGRVAAGKDPRHPLR